MPAQLGKLSILISMIMAAIGMALTAELYVLTGRYFLLVFMVSMLLVVISTYGVKKGDKKFIEWTLRRGGRFLITLAFIWMIIFA